MVNFGYPYNDIVICKDSTDYLLVATHFNNFFCSIAENLVSKLPPIRGKFDFNFVCNFYKEKCENSEELRLS